MNNFNLQDSVLNFVRKEKIRITIFLVNGYKITGNVKAFDNYVILLLTDKGKQVVYKHAISTIIPEKDINIFNNENQLAME